MSKEHAYKTLTHAVAAVIGAAFTAIALNANALEIGRTIDPSNLLSLVVTLVLGAIVFRQIEQWKHSDQLTRTIALQRISSVVSVLEKLQEELSSQSPNYFTLVATLKSVGVHHERFLQTAAALKLALPDASPTEFLTRHRLLRTLVTDTPVLPGSSPDVRKDGNNMTYSDRRAEEIQLALSDCMKHLYAMETHVIKALW